MISTEEKQIHTLRDPTITMLHELGIHIHRLGYKYLTVAVPCYSIDDTQSLTKELYPFVASCFGCGDWRSVERSIRTVILTAWDHRTTEIWNQYFPNQSKVPSSKQFIATLSERLK